jgi:transcriptional regulator GlxA family with amidase domain
MRESLSIRAYKPAVKTHSHHFHQIVVPLRGSIEIALNEFDGLVAVGHCVVIRKNVDHSFKAREQARFLVADLHDLPESARSLDCPFATVSNAFKAFCLFVDIQLSTQKSTVLEDSMIAVFKQLLSLQDFLPHIDRRISRALEHIEGALNENNTLNDLASISSLSVSQFKVLFARHTGMTLGRYVLMLRMEKARALLANTDMPISIVADHTGYADHSAFARRFQAYHGISPSEYKKR